MTPWLKRPLWFRFGRDAWCFRLFGFGLLANRYGPTDGILYSHNYKPQLAIIIGRWRIGVLTP